MGIISYVSSYIFVGNGRIVVKTNFKEEKWIKEQGFFYGANATLRFWDM